MLAVLGLAAAGAGLGATADGGQDGRARPAPTATPPDDDGPIRIATELVNLSVRVIDRSNRPVNNLRREDFRVFEDGAPQNIEFFSTLEVPTTYALVIDNSGSLRQQLDKVIEASKVMVGTNRSEDQTSVIRFISSDKIEVVEEFTSDKSLIGEALDNLYVEGGQTAIIDAVFLAAERVSEHDKESAPSDRRRRALVVVTDGEDRNSFYKEAQLYEMLRETDVQIYTVGFVGDLANEGGFISKSPQAKARAFLERLSGETGGKSYFPKSVQELNGIAADIGREMRMQYSIGYLPSDGGDGRKTRSIRVAVADGPNKEKRIAVTRSGVRYDSAPADSQNQRPPRRRR
jgi:Ca-activated chloride channel family protein